MKLSNNKLRLHTGKVIQFKDAEARKKFEKYAIALKHGWKPNKKK